MSSPTPADVRAARESAGLSQSQAAALALVSTRAWIKWESGENAVSLPAWTLFRLRAGIISMSDLPGG